MPIVNMRLDAVGRGALIVDGTNLSGITSAVSIASAAGEANKVTIELGACKLQDIDIQDADLSIKGEKIPESIQSALYEFLRKKYDKVDVTVLSDESRNFGLQGESFGVLEAALAGLTADVRSLQASVKMLCRESVKSSG